MAEVQKLLYVVVVDDDEKRDDENKTRSSSSFRYTRPVLQSCLQLMGCKARHAFKISRRVFEVMRVGGSMTTGCTGESIDDPNEGSFDPIGHIVSSENGIKRSNSGIQFELYKRQTTIVILRETFLDVVCDALSQYKYMGPNQRADLVLSCRIKEKKESITVLLCGTSGCGKSTLSALLGIRLGVTTVISTDSIRHMKRSFVDEKKNPLLWASTYHAGEFLDPVAVADAKAKRKAKKTAGDGVFSSQKRILELDIASKTALISEKQMAVEGFKAQSEMVIDSLDRLITAWEDRKESVIVEGVHLSLNFVVDLMKKHPSIIPFMIYIVNEEKHMERFAVRAKHMTLDPSKNKYIKYIRNIRTIQEYLCNRADKHRVPKVNNTNVDRSVAAIHATVFSCLRRRETGEQFYDPITNTVPMIDEEYRNQCAANSLSSKGMLQLIQMKGSRHLMALVNTDGSVAKSWPVDSIVSSIGRNGRSELVNGNDSSVGSPLYGLVNLQFGSFGISAWPTDTGGTSHNTTTTSVDDGSGTQFSSCCSSPRTLDGPAKKHKKAFSVSGSEEEEDDAEDDSHVLDTDDDDDPHGVNNDEGGSVDESTKSDEEYEDLAMQDGQDNGYWSDDDEPYIYNFPLHVRKRSLNNPSLSYIHPNGGGGAPAMDPIPAP